ncbi:MAG: hypothetical protein F7B18_06075, partial [Desulfurococcales archaeon]|nr:hypothetical protein [Desulfurococcales archaeon]
MGIRSILEDAPLIARITPGIAGITLAGTALGLITPTIAATSIAALITVAGASLVVSRAGRIRVPEAIQEPGLG